MIIHESTMRLMGMMYDQEQMMDLVFTFMADYAEMRRDGYRGYPFMVLQFADNPPILTPDDKPPTENFIWN